MSALQKRLKWCMKRGNLTVADLARWLERPHPTVRTWVVNGTEPGGGPADIAQVYQWLSTLESLINGRPTGRPAMIRFPVPRLSPRRRIAYLTEIRRNI